MQLAVIFHTVTDQHCIQYNCMLIVSYVVKQTVYVKLNVTTAKTAS